MCFLTEEAKFSNQNISIRLRKIFSTAVLVYVYGFTCNLGKLTVSNVSRCLNLKLLHYLQCVDMQIFLHNIFQYWLRMRRLQVKLV